MAKLFIPGPTDVAQEVLRAQNQAMVGHRSQACADLIGRIQPKLKKVFKTRNRVFISTSSGTGFQEACVRNCVADRILVCVCGAFGGRWYDVAEKNGIHADRLDAEWGQPNTPDEVEEALKILKYDAIAVVHNETSTGVENPIAEIAARARAVHPDILVLVDAVSSASGSKIETDSWGLDVVFTSSQKCFALPPGLAFAAVSDKALRRAEVVENRGWYFDFLLLEKYLQRNTTPATPAISLLYALDLQLDRMLREGMAQRFARHAQLANMAQTWASKHFELYAAQGFRSKTVTTIRNTRQVQVAQLNRHLAEHGMTIANGYGPLKDQTFRIGHMGEIQPEDLEQLLESIDTYLAANS